ncbi:MAG TPA: hypothetical protein VN860_02620 [Candidatus Acidoferrales bacterium]|nr:hypothetical protein [Candidatus Acidoferrales bacterium]
MRAPLTHCIVGFSLLLALGSALVPRTALAEALPAAGEGCMGQWMFNGIWRVRVTKVDPLNDSGGKQIGWLVTEQWRNGTDRKLAPGNTFAKDQVLVLANGAQIAATETTQGTLSSQDLGFHDFPPSAQYTHLQKFIAAGALDASNKPAAVVIPFDAAKEAANKPLPPYSVNPPNFKIKLDCTATPQQQAQGGSFELPAKAGCLSQWLANGLWKMRVTQVGPEIDNGTQVGWLVTQEWTNVSGRKLQPIQSWVEDEQLVLANGDTVSSGNETTTTFKVRELVNRDFNPGSSYTHTQNFRYDRPAFDPSNKAVKLLVVWDVGAYKYFTGKPFPGNPPNFRISFSCP